jgi:hypothetical protein
MICILHWRLGFQVPPIPGTEESREVDIAKIFDSDK